MSEATGGALLDENGGEESILADWAAELAERLGRGEPVDLDALAEAHPEHAGELRRLLPTIRRMAALGRAVARPPGAIAASDRPGPGGGMGTLGDFRLLREVGRGGMGIVYEAEQISLGRRVALKILPMAGALDPRSHQRFQLEARAAACLHHAHIVPVHAVGAEGGVPYYAMQFVEGRTLAQVIAAYRGLGPRDDPGAGAPPSATTRPLVGPTAEDRPIPPPPSPSTTLPGPLGDSNRDRGYIRAAAGHGRRVAEALDHAHALGIIHRDIKPANLMLDVHGRIWVMDFGLARFLGDSTLTLTGDVIGTLRYMSPEQAMARRVVVDGRADLYSLGATLYELLTLRPAVDGEDRSEILRRIAHDDPIPPRKLNPAMPADLETIVLKALAREPSDRYATARDLADDLGRFLDGRPIAARPPGAMERLGRWARRNRALVASASAFAALAVLVLAAGLIWSNRWLIAHNDRLRLERDRAAAFSRALEAQRDLANERRRIADRHVYASRLQRAGTSLRARRFEVAQEILRGLLPSPGEDDLREFAWHHLWRESRKEVAVLSEWGEHVGAIALSSDGRRVATGDRDGTIRVRDAATGDLRGLFRGHPINIGALAFSADGRRLASGTADNPRAPSTGLGEVRLWDVASGRPLARLDGFEDRFSGELRFDPSGAYLWEQSGRRGVRLEVGLWALEGPPDALRARLIRRRPGGPNIPVSGDGRRVAWYEGDGRVAVVEEAISGRVLLRIPSTGEYRGFGLSDDGRLVATAAIEAPDRPLRLVVREVETGRIVLDSPEGPGGGFVDRLVFGPGGHSIMALGISGAMRHFDLDTGTSWAPEADPRDQGQFIGDLALVPGGRLLAWSYLGARTGPRPLRIHDRAGGQVRATFPGRAGLSVHGFGSPDGRSLVFGCETRAVLWHFRPEADPQPAGHADEAWAVAFSGDGRTLATGSDDTDDPMTLKLWDAATGRLVRGWKPHQATTAAVAFQPGGRILATAGLAAGANLRLWDPTTGALLATLDGHTNGVRTLAFSPDGGRLASAGNDRTVRLWDMADFRRIRSLAGHSDKIRQVAFSPDGRTLVSAGGDAAVRLWDLDGPGPPWEWKEGGVKIAAVAFSPDGRTLAWAHEDGVIQRLDLAARRRLVPSHIEQDELMSLAFSPDGHTLAVASKSGNIHLCDPISGQVTLTLEAGPRAQANGVAFSPDGSTLAACWHDGRVRMFRAR